MKFFKLLIYGSSSKYGSSYSVWLKIELVKHYEEHIASTGCTLCFNKIIWRSVNKFDKYSKKLNLWSRYQQFSVHLKFESNIGSIFSRFIQNWRQNSRRTWIHTSVVHIVTYSIRKKCLKECRIIPLSISFITIFLYRKINTHTYTLPKNIFMRR